MEALKATSFLEDTFCPVRISYAVTIPCNSSIVTFLRSSHSYIMSPFRIFYQNDQFFNSLTMYSNSSSYNSSYMDLIDSKIPPIAFKLGEECPKG